MTYYLNLNNCHITYNNLKLSLITKFLDNFMNAFNENDYIEICQLFHLFKQH